jgi:hypothetical protein
VYNAGVVAGEIRYLGAKKSVEVWRSGLIGSYRNRYRRRLAGNECDVDDEWAKDAGMIEKCRCGRVLGEGQRCWYAVFGLEATVRCWRKGGFPLKWISRLEVVDERWDWAGAERGLAMLCFLKGPTLGRRQ